MTWVAAAVGVGTIGYGMYQDSKGRKDAKKGEAKLTKEASIRNKLAAKKQERLELKAAMSGEMPGSTRRKNVIGQNTAQRINASKETSTSAANQQAMIAQSVLGQQDEYGKIAAETEQYRDDAKMDAIEGMSDIAKARGIDIDLAEGELARGEALKGAGQQNVAGGLTSIATTLATGIDGKGKRGRRGKKESPLTKGQIEGRAAEEQYAASKRETPTYSSRSDIRKAKRKARKDAEFKRKVDKDIDSGFYN